VLLRVGTIAQNTYREAVRARILLGLAGVAFAVSLFSLVIGSFTLNNAPRVVTDLGTASISLFSVAVAVVIGATSLYRELEQKTIFPILARPIGRTEYIVGKYFGILLTLYVFIAADAGLVLSLAGGLAGKSVGAVAAGLGLPLLALVAAAIRWPAVRTYGPIPWAFAMLVVGAFLSDVSPDDRRMVLTATYLTMLEVAIVAAIATLFSSFSSPFLSALLTLGLWLVGRSSDSLDRFPEKFFGATVSHGAKLLGKIVPNLQLYVPPRPLLTGEAADVNRMQYLLFSTGVAVGWSVVMLVGASFVFKRRDFL
jgi:ABC-type transport system involved in multi-copper enzyme maturation permease subunit